MVSDKDLWGALSSEQGSDKGEKSLDEILKEDSSSESQGKALAGDGGRRKLALAGAGTALVIAIAGVTFINPFSGSGLFGPDEEEKVSQIPVLTKPDSSKAPAADPSAEDAWYNQEENILPIDEPAWSAELAEFDATQISPAQKEWVTETVGRTRLGTISSLNLPSEAQGYTSDPAEATTENGLPNVAYSYWTSGLFQQQSTLITNKLLNPLYGGWTTYQYGDAKAAQSFDLSIMGDIFTDRYRTSLASNKAATPIFADWNANNYGLQGSILSSGGPRWTGEITDADISFTYSDELLGYTADATYQVKFTSWTNDQQTITKDGVLKLKFVPDNSAVEDEKSFRILVDGGSLTVK